MIISHIDDKRPFALPFRQGHIRPPPLARTQTLIRRASRASTIVRRKSRHIPERRALLFRRPPYLRRPLGGQEEARADEAQGAEHPGVLAADLKPELLPLARHHPQDVAQS